jgi:hypothetical protein
VSSFKRRWIPAFAGMTATGRVLPDSDNNLEVGFEAGVRVR